MVPIYVLNDVVGLIRIEHVGKDLFEYVMVKKVEYLLMNSHAYILWDWNDGMMKLKQWLLVREMHVRLKRIMMSMYYCHFAMLRKRRRMNLFFPMVLKKKN
jgi:hypothetical protein